MVEANPNPPAEEPASGYFHENYELLETLGEGNYG